MSDLKAVPGTVTEEEEARISAWRAERARVAEAEKAARLSQKAEDRAAEQAATASTQTDAAQALLDSTTVHATPTASPVQAPFTLTAALAVPTATTPHAPSTAGKVQPPSIPSQKRRRWHGRIGFWSQFSLIVVAPVVLAVFYLAMIATPLFEAQSVIAITKSARTTEASRAGLLGSLQGPANLPEVFRAHAYVKSQALMDALEADQGLVTLLSSDAIDPVQRLKTIPGLSLSKRMQFARFVETSVDVQSGLLTLYVRAPSQALAISISEAALRETEIQVNALGQQVFDERQSLARQALQVAQDQLTKAQAALVALQIQYQEADPRNRIEGVYSTIRDLEAQAQSLHNEIQKAEIAGIGDSAQTQQTAALEQRLREQIEAERARLVAPDGSGAVSLNTLLMQYELANLNVSLARDAVTTSLQIQAETGQAAALNRSLFQVAVPPRTAQTAIYPKSPRLLALVLVLCLTLFAMLRLMRAARH